MSSMIKVEIEKENFYELTNYEMVDFIHEIYKQNLIKEAGVEEDWFDDETKHSDYYVSSNLHSLGLKLLYDAPYWLWNAIDPDKAPFLRLEYQEYGADPRLFNVNVLNKHGDLIAKFYLYTEIGDRGFGHFGIDDNFQSGVKDNMDSVANGEIKLEDI